MTMQTKQNIATPAGDDGSPVKRETTQLGHGIRHSRCKLENLTELQEAICMVQLLTSLSRVICSGPGRGPEGAGYPVELED